MLANECDHGNRTREFIYVLRHFVSSSVALLKGGAKFFTRFLFLSPILLYYGKKLNFVIQNLIIIIIQKISSKKARLFLETFKFN